MKVRFAVSVGLGPPDPLGLGSVVERAEQLGFDTVWMSDVPSLPSTDPSLGVAYAAARSGRMHLGINLIPFGSTPYVVAHRLAQLDRLAGGRLLVTLVPGLDLPGERQALGTDGRHRGRMMDQVIPQLRAWWAGETVDGLALPVGPLQQPLELWLGGSGPEAVRRAGRLADGWLGSLVTPARAGEIRAAIQAEAAAAGRTVDPEHFGLSIGYARRPGDVERAARLRPVRPRRPEDAGDPADLVPVGADRLRRLVGELVEAGLSKFVVRPVAPVEDWEGELAWLAETVLDLQT
ncbi:MAG TPA: LLM class flavin-dependent oxidoreductase [Acidimicrobiales bacterium]|nr:LLM class flavin-dependent oxidoreductase [Acidimicrobiales bacterium]